MKILIQIIGLIFLICIPALSQNLKLMPPLGHNRTVHKVLFSPDGKKIITGSMDNTVKIWDTETGKLLSDLSFYNFIDDYKKTFYIKLYSSTHCLPSPVDRMRRLSCNETQDNKGKNRP